ncbi:MAG TPA: hypothetical protein VJ770_05985 [Stellaceae bacterium]|nr:hypothetical protein [Stellaceae bacterium]
MSAENQVSAAESPPKRPRRDKWRPRFPIDRRTLIGRRVADFERDLVAAVLAGNGKSRGKPRPLDLEQRKSVRLACAFEALCARLEAELLTGASLDHRALIDAMRERDAIARKLIRHW